MIDSIEITPGDEFEDEDLCRLYPAVGWSAYTAEVPALARMVDNSSYSDWM